MGKRRWAKGITRDFLRVAFRNWFGIQDNQAEVIVTLYERRGRPLSAREIAFDVDTHKTPSAAAIMERIRVVREAMSPESVDRNERGYFLSEVGQADCHQALHDAAVLLAQQCLVIDVEALTIEEIGPDAEDDSTDGTMAA